MAANTNLGLVVPTTEEQTVAATWPDAAEIRAALAGAPDAGRGRAPHCAAKQGRWGHRDATMVLVAYRHGLRASELTDLRWDQVDFSAANLHVRRAKKCSPATHPILGDELRAFRRLQREQVPKSPFVFTSERGDAQGTSLELARARPEDLLASAVSTVGRRAKAPSRCGCSAPIPRKSNRRCTVPSSSYGLARRSNSSWSRWINSNCSAGVIKLS